MLWERLSKAFLKSTNIAPTVKPLSTYAMLLSGITWNIPRVTCIVWYTHEPLGECVYQENTSDKWDIPRLFHNKGLHNYFMPCHRKYGTVTQWEGWVWHNWIALIDGKVRCNTDEYTTAFLHSDWLYFLWHGLSLSLSMNQIEWNGMEGNVGQNGWNGSL